MAGKTLLIVEDNAILRQGLASVLRHEGFRVVTAKQGDEALAYLERNPAPDFILLDVLIPPPSCDGWRFLELRKQNPAFAAIPVILTTALESANREWAQSLGAAGFLKKPFDLAALLVEIRRCSEAG